MATFQDDALPTLIAKKVPLTIEYQTGILRVMPRGDAKHWCGTVKPFCLVLLSIHNVVYLSTTGTNLVDTTQRIKKEKPNANAITVKAI